MQLREVYRPVIRELESVEEMLRNTLQSTKYAPILKMGNYLLKNSAKRLRPTMVLMSAKAIDPSAAGEKLINAAAAVELIHMASLIHDDIIDHSLLRHNKPTINYKWGDDASIVFGDYLYSMASDLVSASGNRDVISCMSSAVRSMCEGELAQVCERDNLSMLRERYITIVKKKTASLFAASCQAGALMSKPYRSFILAMKGYGLNFGIAFQIVDDYLDVIGEELSLGKKPGQDMRVGEITLPILNLLESIPEKERDTFKMLFLSERNDETLQKIRKRMAGSGSMQRTKEEALFFVNCAKRNIRILPHSRYKEGLMNLADYVMERGFNDKDR